MRVPRATTPLFAEYKAMCDLLLTVRHIDIYQMTIEEFVKLLMYKSHGFMSPERARRIYFDLMEEAGLEPLYEKDKN